MRQPIYFGPWRRGDVPPDKAGDLVLMHRFSPAGPCCTCASPVRIHFAPAEGATELTEEELIQLGGVLQAYRGVPTSLQWCGIGGAQVVVPRGNFCTDLGLGVAVDW